MKVMCREAFAPLVSIVFYKDFEDALRMLGDSPYGLQAGIYTQDLRKAFRAVAALDVGGDPGERHVDFPGGPHAVWRQPHERHRQGRRALCRGRDDEPEVCVFQPCLSSRP